MPPKDMRPNIIRYLTTSWRLAALAGICGAIMALGQAPLSLPFGLLVALPALGWLFLNNQGRKQAFLTGWYAGSAYFMASIFWIMEPFYIEADVFGWMAPFALLFMSIGLALFWGAGFLLASFACGKPLLRLAALAAAWTFAEFLRAHILTGFPWGLLAYVWSETPLFQILAYVGPHGLGLLTLAIGFTPLLASRNIWFGGSYAVLMVALLWVGGQWRLADTQPLTETRVRLVQPNAPQRLKWRSDMIPVFYNRALKLTRAVAKERRPDVVVWPETAIPFTLGSDTMALQALVRAAGPTTQILAGIRRYQDNRLYNSMLYLDRSGGILAVYDKHHLVPFGEYMPLGNLLSRFGIRGMADTDGGGFSAGSGTRILRGAGLPDFLPLICYEAIFPGLSQLGNERPKWLLHITNDAWFGNFAGPQQHLAQARARAIEQGLPLARAANTGVSAMIDPFGRILASIPLNQAGFLDARLPAPLGRTAYSYLGEWPWLLISLLIGIIVSLKCRKGQGNRQAGI